MICEGASGGVDGAGAAGDVANGAGEAGDVFSHTESNNFQQLNASSPNWT